MVTESLLNIVFGVLSGFFSLFPNIAWDIDLDVASVFFGFVGNICYLLPMKTVILVLGIVVALNIFKITIAFIKTIWELLPLV